MATVNSKVSKYDLIRIGTYSQCEGNFRFHKRGGYRFTFYTQQIGDMEDLIAHVIDNMELGDKRKNTYIQFYSKGLYERLKELGFYNFFTHNWNIPKVIMQGESYKNEYLKGVIDSLGNVDVDSYKGGNTPYVKIQSINESSLSKLSEIFGGTYYSLRDRAVLQWKGQSALDICNRLNWRFNCLRNQRGSELIRHINWEKFIW